MPLRSLERAARIFRANLTHVGHLNDTGAEALDASQALV